MAFTNSPNIGMPIPGVGTELGPNYAQDVNASLTLLDQHDHSPGKGLQITPAGLNINTDLSIQGNNLTLVNSVIFQALTSDTTPLSLYVAPGTESPTPINDLWFTDGAGNEVQLTAGGLVNATIANIPGESYSAGTFTWKQGAGSTTPANFDIGSIILRPNVAATTLGVQLAPSSGISSQYTITQPLLPASTSFVVISNSGVETAPTPFPLQASGIANNTITAAQIANGTITSTQISPTADITGGQLSSTAGITGGQLSASAGIVGTQLASNANILDSQLSAPTTWSGTLASPVSIATGGGPLISISAFIPIVNRPVMYNYQTSGATTNGSVIFASNSSATFTTTAGTTVVSKVTIDNTGGGDQISIPISSLNCFIPSVSVGGTHTTVLSIVANPLGGSGFITIAPAALTVMQI